MSRNLTAQLKTHIDRKVTLEGWFHEATVRSHGEDTVVRISGTVTRMRWRRAAPS